MVDDPKKPDEGREDPHGLHRALDDALGGGVDPGEIRGALLELLAKQARGATAALSLEAARTQTAADLFLAEHRITMKPMMQVKEVDRVRLTLTYDELTQFSFISKRPEKRAIYGGMLIAQVTTSDGRKLTLYYGDFPGRLHYAE